ncbi:MAG: biotin--[acetyl-CoA-carboxylase] ligase [Thermodesulfobacteriota bacterium]
MKEKDSSPVEIIRRLNAAPPPGFVSGESLSRTLSISRTAVWKQIKGLKKMGFAIESVPSKGYRLEAKTGSADPFNAVSLTAGLASETIGKKIFFYDSLDSTNTRAFELGRSGEPEGAVVIAETQTSGKGRLGRIWESPAGVNLYASIIIRPNLAPYEAQGITLLAAVTASEAIAAFVPSSPVVKWPNDVLIGSRKVAGILTEMDTEPERINFIVVGIGVNVNMTKNLLPDSLKAVATSLRDSAGGEVSRTEFALSLFYSFEKWYKIYLTEGLPPVLGAWKGLFASEGKPVRVTGLNDTIEGICMGVDSTGALLVRRASGGVEKVLAGDVEMVRRKSL